jgi:hypothetical protein
MMGRWTLLELLLNMERPPFSIPSPSASDFTRRAWLQCSLWLATACATGRPALTFAEKAQGATAAMNQAHEEIWKRFIDANGIMLDFTDLDGKVSLPTPEECQMGKPNALGWWSPIENGAMFNGLYMDAAVNRWRNVGADADKARRLMKGLLLLNSISDVPGFIGRGVSTDGKSHYPMGSNDQTLPWFLGLWRYWESALATEEERERIADAITRTAEIIVNLKWSMPAELPFGRRGSFTGFTFDSATRQLFVMKILHAITGDAKWDAMYRAALEERGGKDNLSKREICARGMVFDYARYHSWTSCCSVGALRVLWELEKDETLRATFAQGLQASADLAFKNLSMAEKFDPHDPSVFDADWRKSMLPLWKPQTTEAEAQKLAEEQVRAFLKQSPRRGKETEFVREPTAAAWVVSLAPDKAILKERAADIERVIAHYDYTKLYYSQFFWVECAWWRLQEAR